MQVCDQCCIKHMHLVITRTPPHIPVMFISPEECLSGRESLCPIGSEAELRPLEVPDDVTVVGGAKPETLSDVDRVHVHCPSSYIQHTVYMMVLYTQTQACPKLVCSFTNVVT